jgi:tRNA dimethylallyltransferase
MLCILGPTASGKSALAMALAHASARPVEIISLDSAQIYQGMDIGTAKPSRAEQQQIRHHLIDLIDPAESYSAARFVQDATRAAQAIRARGHVPILVGGTMLYYKAYVEGLDNLPSCPPAIRQTITAQAAASGWPALHHELAQCDPETAARLQPTDAQRISRALELYRYTGKTMSALIRDSKALGQGLPEREALAPIALLPDDRALLHRRIEARFDHMIEQGLMDEVRTLTMRHDLSPTLPSMRCVGYRQAWAHLRGEITHDEFREQGIAATRQLAKRQITWLRSFTELPRFDPLTEIGMRAARQAAQERLL